MQSRSKTEVKADASLVQRRSSLVRDSTERGRHEIPWKYLLISYCRPFLLNSEETFVVHFHLPPYSFLYSAPHSTRHNGRRQFKTLLRRTICLCCVRPIPPCLSCHSQLTPPLILNRDSPVSFSSQVVNNLQNSPEVRFPSSTTPPTAQRNRSKKTIQLTNKQKTDSVRARTQELHIQQRVTAELEKLRQQESTRLDNLTTSLTPENPSDDTSDHAPSLKDKISNALPFGGSSSDNARSHDSVSKEVAELKAKLERRQKKADVDREVEAAKEKLVQCLRTKDRRPLDCWEEVEGFKREVARLEARFVDKALR